MAETYKLTNQNIDLISEKCQAYYHSRKINNSSILKLRLTLEEVLMTYQEAFGEDCEVTIKEHSILGQNRFILMVPGKELNALDRNEDDFVLSSLINSYEKGEPTYTYSNLQNKITFSTKRQHKFSMLFFLAIAIVAAIVLGSLSSKADPTIMGIIINDYINPLNSAYSGVLCVMAVILVFLKLAIGIADLGDLSNAGKIAKNLISKFFIVPLAFIVIYSLPYFIFLRPEEGGHIDASFGVLYDQIISFIPTNIITPFVKFDAMQIMVIGLMFGLSMLVLGDKIKVVKRVFEEIDLIAIITNDFLAKFIAIYVFLELFTAYAQSEISVLRYSLYLILFTLGGMLAIIIFYSIVIAIRFKMNPFVFLKKVLPGFLISLSTSNYAAGFSIYMDELINDLGVEPRFAGLGLQTSGSLFRPSQALFFIMSVLYISNYYNISATISWYIIAIILCLMLSMSVPNTIGGAVAIIPLLFTQLSMPHEGLTWIIALSSIMQFPILAVDTFCAQSQILLTGKKLDKVNTAILKSNR